MTDRKHARTEKKKTTGRWTALNPEEETHLSFNFGGAIYERMSDIQDMQTDTGCGSAKDKRTLGNKAFKEKFKWGMRQIFPSLQPDRKDDIDIRNESKKDSILTCNL